MNEAVCHHLARVTGSSGAESAVTPGADGCEECLANGDDWVHLRLCMTCGHVGCCNESVNRHASAHFRATGHPIIRSFEPDEHWLWCFVDQIVTTPGNSNADKQISKESMRSLQLFADLSEEDLETVFHMAEPRFATNGTPVMTEGEPGNEMFVILDGELEISKRRGEVDDVLNVLRPGQFVGEMALLDRAPRTATARARGDVALLSLSQQGFDILLARSPAARQIILKAFRQRLVDLEEKLREGEKLRSLGILSAGLAHELNNPASALWRGASMLKATLTDWEAAVVDLGRAGIDDAARAEVVSLRDRARSYQVSSDPLDRADREDEVHDWLDAAGIDHAWDLAPAFVQAGWDTDRLDQLSQVLAADQVTTVARWLALSAVADDLLTEITVGAESISSIVRAVKSYSHLDEAHIQSIDLHEGLDNTLVLLRHKLKGGVTVVKEYDPNLPHIQAFGSELNQVWTNIIDNAIGAMGGHGEIHVRTRRQGASVVVQIQDNGPGIPQDVQSAIFDPFVTTKAPGEGTGMGLYISYNTVVNKHRGTIALLTSEPGNTTFEVRLPTHLEAG